MADGSVIIDTKLDESGLKEGLGKLGGKVAKGITTAVTATTAALGTGAVAVVNYGSEFESAFAGVKKTVDASEAELAALKQGILDMSAVIPEAASDIAAVTEAAGQLGIKNDSLLSFTETMVNLGVATNLSATEAATSLARLANITQMDQADFDKLGSSIVALGNNLATTEREIVDMALRLAGTGAQVGMTEDQILALAAAFSSVGIESETGGSSISKVLSMMQLATEKGGESLDAFAKVSGVSAEEFKKAFGDDAANALTMFIQGLAAAEDSGQSAIAVLDELSGIDGLASIDELRVKDSLLRAAGANNVLIDALDISKTAWEENTALINEAAQRYETFDSKLTMLKNSAKNFAVSIYDEIQAPLKEATEYATGLVGELSAAFAEGGLDGLLNAVGGVLGDILSKIVEYAPTIISAVSNILLSLISALVENADKIGEGLGGVMVVLAEAIVKAAPLLLDGFLKVVTAIGGTIAEALPTFIPLLVQGIIDLANVIVNNIEPFIDAGLAIIDGLIEGLVAAAPVLIEALPKIIEKLVAVLPTVIKKISQALIKNTKLITDAFISIFGAIVKVLPTIINSIVAILPDIINAVVAALLEMMPLIIDCGIQLLTSLVGALPDIIATIVEVLPSIIDAVIVALLTLLPMIIDCGIQLLTALIDALPVIITTITAVLPSIIDAVITALIGLIPLIIDCGIQLLTSLVEALPEIITAIVGVTPTIIEGLISAFIEMQPLLMKAGIDLFVSLIKELPKIIVAIVKAVPQIITAIVNGFKEYWNKMKEAGSNILSKIGDGFKAAADIGKNLVQGIWNGISNAKDWIIDKIKGFGDSILGGLKDFFGIKSPSKLMENIIGKNLSLGIAEGIADESDSAVDAMTDVAKRIKSTEFDDDFDYSFALQRVVTTVNSAAEQNTARISGDSNPYRQIPTKEDKGDKTSSESQPSYIENVINIDGKTVARVVTPYVEKELAWRNK